MYHGRLYEKSEKVNGHPLLSSRWLDLAADLRSNETTARRCSKTRRAAADQECCANSLAVTSAGRPSVCEQNGELVAVFSGDRDEHVCPWGKVQMIKSTDGGETWSAERTICNTPLDDRDAGIVELPNRDLLVTWFTSVAYAARIKDRSSLRPGSPEFYWALHDEKISPSVKEEWLGYFTVRSTDGGLTWEKLVRTRGSQSRTILPKDGRLLFVAATTAAIITLRWKTLQHAVTVEESRDGGRSWQFLTNIEPTPPDEIEQFQRAACRKPTMGALSRSSVFTLPAPGALHRDDS